MAHLRALLDRSSRRPTRARHERTPRTSGKTLPLFKALVDKLPDGAPADRRGRRAGPPRLGLQKRRRRAAQDRYGELRRPPVHVALVNNNTKTGVFVLSARAPRTTTRGPPLRAGLPDGRGVPGSRASHLFLETWAAGLAYSMVSGPPPPEASSVLRGALPDLTATLRFVASLAKETRLDAPFFVDFALANCFSDYRAAEGVLFRGLAPAIGHRGRAAAETVRRFKQASSSGARTGCLDQINWRLPASSARSSSRGGKGLRRARGLGLLHRPGGPPGSVRRVLMTTGSAKRLIRLYPRDFWLPES